ncbi:hypothetical protein DIPPA_27437 [Diplonema papillatum]|nr:hypothetical protein DIPPA_27437 [Diplonema papillatum]
MDPVGDFTDSQSGHQASPYDQQQQGYGQQYEQQHSGQYGQPYGHDEGVGGYGQGAALDLPDPPMRAQQSEPNLQIQDQAHAYAALQQAAAQAQALAYGSEPSAQTPLAPIPQHQHQQHHQQQHEQQQHQPLGYAPFDEADPFAAQKLLLQQQPDLMRAAPSQPSYSSFQEPTRSPLDPPGYTFDPLDLGKPPVAPQISGSAGDNLRRMTSGIQGVNAPNWAAVEKDLRQNTLTDFLRRMFDTLTQQHMALGKLNEAMSNCYSELKYTKQSHEAAQDTITNLRLQQESSAAHLHSLPDALHEFKTRIGDLEVDLGPTRPQAVSGPQYDTLGNVITVPTTRERAEKKTLRETVDELASQHNKLCNVVRRERYGRLKHAGWILANMNVSALQRRYFRKWLTWLKLEPDIRREQGRALMAMSALSGTRTGLRAMYWSKLKGFVNWARKQHYRADRYCRALRRVNHSCSKHRLQVYWNKLKNFLSLIAEERQAYHVANTRKAGLLANISLQALQLRYFNKLLSHRTSRVQNAEKLRIVTVLENLCFTALRKRYYSGLLASAQWKKYRRDRYDLAARLETKLLLKRYLETWAQHAAMTRRYLERIAVSRALSTKNSQRVRRTFYHLLSRYAVLRLKSREQIEMDQRLLDVELADAVGITRRPSPASSTCTRS